MNVMRKYKDRLEGNVAEDMVVGNMVRVENLLGGRKITEKMKQTFRSKLEMLKRSSNLTNEDHSHTDVKAVTEKDDNTTSIDNNSLPTPITAQARILEKLKLSKQQGGGVTAGNMARSVGEKLEVARKQFEEMN